MNKSKPDSIRCCIIGCTNIGKSSLFNKLCKYNHAITYDRTGVTVDIRTESVQINDTRVEVIDTPGFDECHESSDGKLQAQINTRILKAIKNSDIIIHVLRAANGMNNDDQDWHQQIIKLNKPLIVVANRCDEATCIHESCYQMANDEPISTNAKSGEGITALRDNITTLSAQIEDTKPMESSSVENDEHIHSIAIVGKPNAGKSTLMNKLCGEGTSIVSRDAGTTVDTVKNHWLYRESTYQVLDTAGLRKKAQIKDGVEIEAVGQSLNSITTRGTVILHMIDATIGVSDQDMRITELVRRKRNKQIMIINKWDKLSSELKTTYRKNIANITRNHPYIPVVMLSAKQDRSFKKLMECIRKVCHQKPVLSTAFLTRNVAEISAKHPPPLIHGKAIKIRLCHAQGNDSYRVAIQGKRLKQLPDSYIKYLSNQLTKQLNLTGIDVEIRIKEDDNPYVS